MKFYKDKFGLYNLKPCPDGNPSGNDGPIITSYAEKLGLPVDHQMVRHHYFEKLAGHPLPTERLPGKKEPPPSYSLVR